MNKYDYYTPRELAKELLRFIPIDAPITKIADICCGTWNLLTAAHTRFPAATLTGVDINAKAVENGIIGAKFIVKDGRDFANEMDEKGERFNLLLSNPPFGQLSVSQKKYFGEDCVQKFKRYESELLYANYLLLEDKGYLIVILPVTYAKGEQYKKHRVWIASNFDVLNIVDLPTNTFGRKSLQTVALVLRKNVTPQNSSADVFIANVDQNKWSFVKKRTVAPSKIAIGQWFEYNGSNISNILIYRGSVSSQFFSKKGEPVIHCSNTIVNGVWEPSVRQCEGVKKTHKKYVESGDIIVNRVGKNAGAWRIYEGEKCLVSDCVIVIKQPSDTTIETILRHSNNGMLQISKLGVSTPYVSSTEISCLLHQLNN